jgi:mono/diheme cytochrome c family protein
MFNRQWLYLLAVMALTACGNATSAFPYEALPPTGDAQRGETLYTQSVGNMPACVGCHIAGAAGAPSLVDLDAYAQAAAERVSGQSAREYTFYAIVEPGQYIVEGYGNAMYNRYDENLNPQQVADLIAYLLGE